MCPSFLVGFFLLLFVTVLFFWLLVDYFYCYMSIGSSRNSFPEHSSQSEASRWFAHALSVHNWFHRFISRSCSFGTVDDASVFSLKAEYVSSSTVNVLALLRLLQGEIESSVSLSLIDFNEDLFFWSDDCFMIVIFVFYSMRITN